MIRKKIEIDFEEYKAVSDLSTRAQELCHKAAEALNSSFSPYSQFKVGTAIALADGEIVLGSNQENIAYPSGLCAERVALFYIGHQKPGVAIEQMAITAQTSHFDIENPITSCGACLQVMVEFERRQGSPIEVLFYCLGGKVLKVPSVQSLMPFAFIEDNLEQPRA